MKMKQCPKCGKFIRNDIKICPSCEDRRVTFGNTFLEIMLLFTGIYVCYLLFSDVIGKIFFIILSLILFCFLCIVVCSYILESRNKHKKPTCDCIDCSRTHRHASSSYCRLLFGTLPECEICDELEHQFNGGCTCERCGKSDEQGEHLFNGCTCERCGKADEQGGHHFKGCKCERCQKVEHLLNGCKCERCGEMEHLFIDCKCVRCGKVEHLLYGCLCMHCGKEEHIFVDGKCVRCGKKCCPKCGKDSIVRGEFQWNDPDPAACGGGYQPIYCTECDFRYEEWAGGIPF